MHSLIVCAMVGEGAFWGSSVGFDVLGKVTAADGGVVGTGV